MNVRLTLVSLVVAVALAGAGCQTAPKPTPAEGPSPLLAGFSVPRIMASFEAMPDGPRCPEIQPTLANTTFTEGEVSSSDRWSFSELVTSCDDPGDGTALAQAWAAGIDAELRRLGADDKGAGVGTTATGASVRDTWEYVSNGLRGHITVQVLPGADGHYWSTVRIFEMS